MRFVPQKSRKKRGRPVQRDNYTPALRGLVQNGLIHNPYPIPEKLPAAVSDDIHRDPSRLIVSRFWWALTVLGIGVFRLLVFGSLARAPSKECGRCLLTKFGLAQFTAGLFWRLGEQRHLAVNIFDALSPHTVAASYARPIHTT